MCYGYFAPVVLTVAEIAFSRNTHNAIATRRLAQISRRSLRKILKTDLKVVQFIWKLINIWPLQWGDCILYQFFEQITSLLSVDIHRSNENGNSCCCFLRLLKVCFPICLRFTDRTKAVLRWRYAALFSLDWR